MSYVAGADFGTLSVRVTIMDTETGEVLGTGIGEYPLKRSESDPLAARQSHDDHMAALVAAMRDAISAAEIDGTEIVAFAADTTGSSVVMVDADLRPLDDYYLWCDHTAHAEAAEITRAAHAEGLEAIKWCGGVYSHEWGYAKLLHFLRHNPGKRGRVATALEHCDMLVATLTGATLDDLPRSICAMGHKWMWGEAWGGLPDQGFLSRVDPLLDGINAKLGGRFGTSCEVAGHLGAEWAGRLGLRPGIPIPFGAFDSHWDAIACGCGPGDLVNVVGTSTCVISIAAPDIDPVPGICGAVPGSVVPGQIGVEAGQSATGDIFDAIATRAGTDVAKLCQGFDARGPGASGLLRLVWDNGDRTILVRSDLGGMTLGWDLHHSAADELHASIEGMAMHLRIIVERMRDHGVVVDRVMNGGGIPQKNGALNQIYADVLGTEVHVPDRSPTGVGACIFAALSAGLFDGPATAQDRLAPPHRIYRPRQDATAIYDDLYALYRSVYFAFGAGEACDLGHVLPALREFRQRGALSQSAAV